MKVKIKKGGAGEEARVPFKVLEIASEGEAVTLLNALTSELVEEIAQDRCFVGEGTRKLITLLRRLGVSAVAARLFEERCPWMQGRRFCLECGTAFCRHC